MVLQIGGPYRSDAGVSNNPCSKADLFVPACHGYRSTLTEAGSGVVSKSTGGFCGLFQCGFDALKWILSKVFCCFNFTGKGKLGELEELREKVAGAQDNLNRLVAKHGLDHSAREALRIRWIPLFDALPVQAKERLQRSYFGDLARGKGYTQEGDIETFVEQMLKNREQCNMAFRFMRDLEPARAGFASTVDPCNVEELPKALGLILESLDAEIAQFEQ